MKILGTCDGNCTTPPAELMEPQHVPEGWVRVSVVAFVQGLGVREVNRTLCPACFAKTGLEMPK